MQKIQEWSEAYPAVDVPGELRRFKVWLEANRTRRKTQKGIARAIVLWLSKAQDKPQANGGMNANRGQQRTDSNIEAARRAMASILAEDAGEARGSEAGDCERIDLKTLLG